MSEANGVANFVRQYTPASGGPYCDCGYKKKALYSPATSATATSLTFVPVGPVRINPPAACKAW